MWGAPLARQIREGPPELVRRADVKKPETSSGFWNWWWNESNTETEILHINDLNRKDCRSVEHQQQLVALCSTPRIATSLVAQGA